MLEDANSKIQTLQDKKLEIDDEYGLLQQDLCALITPKDEAFKQGKESLNKLREGTHC